MNKQHTHRRRRRPKKVLNVRWSVFEPRSLLFKSLRVLFDYTIGWWFFFFLFLSLFKKTSSFSSYLFCTYKIQKCHFDVVFVLFGLLWKRFSMFNVWFVRSLSWSHFLRIFRLYMLLRINLFCIPKAISFTLFLRILHRIQQKTAFDMFLSHSHVDPKNKWWITKMFTWACYRLRWARAFSY